MHFIATGRMQYKSVVRVIAGTAKGRKLHVPRGMTTRPTPARVREALFSIIAAHVPDARVLDLYAGTGALGIEALSRGAHSATFVEQDRQVVPLLRRNVAAFEAPQIFGCAAHHAMAALAQAGAQFDLVFVDPPYPLDLIGRTLQALVKHALLATNALVVCEHHGKMASPAAPAPLQLQRHRAFGDVALSLYALDAAAQPDAGKLPGSAT